jgi:uncharacterized phage-associated protein
MADLTNWFVSEKVELEINMHNKLQYVVYKAHAAFVTVEKILPHVPTSCHKLK